MKPSKTLLTALLLSLVAVPAFCGGKEEETPLRRLVLALMEVNGLKDKYDQVVEEFHKENSVYKPKGRLSRVGRVLDDPLALETVAMEIRNRLEIPLEKEGVRALPEVLAGGAEILDLSVEAPPELPVLEEDALPEDFLPYIEEVLALAARHRDAALENLSEEEIDLAWEVSGLVLDRFIEHIYLEDAFDAQGLRHAKAGLKALYKVDLAEMVQAARVIARFTDPDLLKKLRKGVAGLKKKPSAEAKAAGFSGDVLAFRQTRFGPIVIGGRRATRYDGPAAFILDLGGNDTYAAAAVTPDGSHGVSVVVDLGGKDTYRTKEGPGPAAACLGVSLLYDLEGSDLYEGTRRSMGFAVGGVAVLLDRKGKDRYEAVDYAQGSAFFGFGLLADLAGKDDYKSALYSQGFGLTRGLGVLVDGEGDDRYSATGKYPSSYGTQGIFKACSQGHGTGLRRFNNTSAPMYGGGIGAILDGEGNDRYTAGNFSQGCGYFFGLGVFSDRKGDDEITGTRYTQGTGAHQAAGILINDEGDDVYKGAIAANQGGTWDITTGMLLDFEGNDTYEVTGDLCQGGAAQTAFALLFDGGGKDTYRATAGASQGASGSFNYHDKPSMGVLIDLGGGKDTYNRPERKNNEVLMEEWYGLFADLKARSIEAALKGSAKALKGAWGSKKKPPKPKK